MQKDKKTKITKNKICKKISAMCYVTLMIFLCGFEFILGISEIIFITYYSEIYPGCRKYQVWVSFVSILDLLLPWFVFAMQYTSSMDPNIKKVFISIQLFLSICGFITYIFLSLHCSDLWQNDMRVLQIFMMLHQIMFYLGFVIILGIFGHGIIRLIKLYIKSKYQIKETEEPFIL